MKKILAAALVALAAGCSGSSEKQDRPLVYAAPLAPTVQEQSALGTAGATLQSSLAYQASTDPAVGAAGLGDQLVSDLGGFAVSANMPDASSAKVARGAVRQAFDTGGMDPACVTTQQVGAITTVTWGSTGVPCEVVVSQPPDPTTGDSMTMTVHVTGTLTWDAGAGETTWNIAEELWMTMVSGGQPVSEHANAGLQGSITVTADRIVVSESSGVHVAATYMGVTMDEGIATTLGGTLVYQASPFCITGGTLTLEQNWTKRPMGQTQDTLPNQGWRIDWSGCGAFTVAHGA